MHGAMHVSTRETAGVVVDEAVRMRPSTGLRPYVAWYSGYRQVGVAPAVHRGLPSPYLTLIFTLDEPLHLAQHVDPRRPPSSYRALLGGLHTSPALVRHEGRQSGIQVALSPLGARTLLGLPAGELAETDEDAALILGPVDQVLEQVQVAPSWPGRFAALDAALRQRVSDRPEVPRPVCHAWHRLLETGGRLPVTDLAREVGWSVRHLTNRLKVETGLTPKTAARVIRFDRARRSLADRAGRGGGQIGTVAAGSGYFDQSHLVREFHALAGCSPSTWLAEECRNVQAGLQPPVKGSWYDHNPTNSGSTTTPAGVAHAAGP